MAPDKGRELGRNDAKHFISRELIDYEPFVALSDMHLVRKTVPVSFDSLHKTVLQLDPDLWQAIDGSVSELARKHGVPSVPITTQKAWWKEWPPSGTRLERKC